MSTKKKRDDDDRLMLAIRDHFELNRELTGDTSWDWLIDDLHEETSERAYDACIEASQPQPDWMFDSRLPARDE